MLDLIFGEGDSGKDLLADLLTATLGPAGAVKVMLGGSGLTVKNLGECLSTASLVFICEVDKTARIPVAALNHSVGNISVVSMKIGPRAITLPCRGNVILLATWSPSGLDSLARGVRNRYRWALELPGQVPGDIDRSALFQRDALEWLLSWLVAEAANAIADERAGREPAANKAIVNAVKDVRYQGGHEVHQQLQDSLEYTGNPEDVLTAEEIADAIEATGGTAPTHAVIDKEIRRL